MPRELLLLLRLVECDFLEERGEHALLVGFGEGLDGAVQGSSARSWDACAKLLDVDVGGFGERALDFLKQVSHECGAADEVKLAGLLIGALLVHIAEEIEEKADDVVVEEIKIGLAAHGQGILDVVAQDGHRLLHHLEVVPLRSRTRTRWRADILVVAEG